LSDQLKSWVQMSKDERTQIAIVLRSLDEFVAAYDSMGSLSGPTSEQPYGGPPLTRFMSNALDAYLCGYYADKPTVGLLPILRSVGAAELALEINDTLERPIGSRSYRRHLREWKNTMLAHPFFRVGPILERVVKPMALPSSGYSSQMEATLLAIYRQTKAAHTLLVNAYPHAARAGRTHLSYLDQIDART
jgi:hypothetical protein